MKDPHEESIWRISMRDQYEGSVWGISMENQYEKSAWRINMKDQYEKSISFSRSFDHIINVMLKRFSNQNIFKSTYFQINIFSNQNIFKTKYFEFNTIFYLFWFFIQNILNQ